MITQDELKEILHYDPDTGDWTWLVDIPSRIKAGMKAGCLKKYGDKQRNVIKIKQRDYLAYRLAFLYMTGKFPSKLIDHENRVPSDDRWINLREATKSQNASNGPGKPRKYNLPRGITFDANYPSKPYRVRCGKTLIGNFDSVVEAQNAYKLASKSIFGEFVYHGT